MTVETNDRGDTHGREAAVTSSPWFLAIVGLLVVSLAALRSVPLGQPWGSDLMNVVLYHGCAHGKSPYSISGPECADPWGRGMYYPPLLFYSFAWTRSLSLERVMQIWSVVQLLAFCGILYVWARRLRARAETLITSDIVIFAALLLIQFPVAFALERGGSDVTAVALVSIAGWCLVRERHLLAGAALGVATAYKLYPAFACAVIVLGLLSANWSHPLRSRQRWRFMEVGVASVAAFALVWVSFYSDSKRYFFEVLPKFADTTFYPGTIGHSLSALAASYARFGAMLAALLIALWGWAAGRAFQRSDYAAGVAGALAIATYLPRTSWDYNLVTTYPLLMVMFVRARADGRWLLLALGVFAIAGERDLFGTPGNALFTPPLHIMLQVAFLVLSALVIAADASNADVEKRGYARFSSSQL